MKKYYILLGLSVLAILVFILYTRPATSTSESLTELKGSGVLHDDEALQLMTTLCFTCHNPDMSTAHGQRLAPPLFKVREHYYDGKMSKEEFVAKVTAFVQNPTQEASLMPGAIRNFGLMPKPAFKEADVKKIAAYVYDNDLSSKEWMDRWEELQNLD